jgi:hypothetical protein
MYKEQNGCCKICLKNFKQGVSAHVDHDHETGEVRGLCLNCNTGIGKLGDSAEICLNAAIYLLATEEPTDENHELENKVAKLSSLIENKCQIKQGKITNPISILYAYHLNL